MKSHQVDYQIIGDDLQFVEVELDPQETVIAEAGGMMYMEESIGFETKMGDGSKPGGGFLSALGSAAKRVVTGESIFMTHFTNSGQGKKRVAFGAPYPGKIIAIDLDEANGELICQKDAFLCAALGTEVSVAFNKKLGAGLFGGEGFILQRLHYLYAACEYDRGFGDYGRWRYAVPTHRPRQQYLRCQFPLLYPNRHRFAGIVEH